MQLKIKETLETNDKISEIHSESQAITTPGTVWRKPKDRPGLYSEWHAPEITRKKI